MSTVQEIEEAIPRLSRAEIERLRDWIDEFLEQDLELSDETKSTLKQSKRHIEDRNYRVHR